MRNFLKAALIVSFLAPAVAFAGADAPKKDATAAKDTKDAKAPAKTDAKTDAKAPAKTDSKAKDSTSTKMAPKTDAKTDAKKPAAK
jgi:multifunctional 2-oxoglutarate metabolism enzyme